jgi:hypothetical protein
MISYSRLFSHSLCSRDPIEAAVTNARFLAHDDVLLKVSFELPSLRLKYVATVAVAVANSASADQLIALYTAGLEDLKRELRVSIPSPPCIPYSTGDVSVQWKPPKITNS